MAQLQYEENTKRRRKEFIWEICCNISFRLKENTMAKLKSSEEKDNCLDNIVLNDWLFFSELEPIAK